MKYYDYILVNRKGTIVENNENQLIRSFKIFSLN